MIDYPLLQPYQERYAGLSMRPVRVELYLKPGAQLAGYDPLNLDNLLARCVVEQATEGQLLPDSNEGYNLPVPLRCLWRSAMGYPLWAATPFVPDGMTDEDVLYWHKRQQSGRWTGTHRGTFTITSTKGRYMERRVPLPTHIADRWIATCIGNLDEIATLLEPLSNVGKRRSMGLGEIDHWRILPAPEEFALIRDGALTRAMPMEAVHLLGDHVPTESPAPVGWTPPQWLRSLFAPGWWPGTQVEIDWYAAALA